MQMLTESDFRDACNDNMGYCTVCQDFTREGTEPDAKGDWCPECGQLAVLGAELALIRGEVTF